MEFEAMFASEEACREYLSRLRWPNGFRCPRCGGDKAWATKRSLWHCTACGRQVSLTAGTIFQDARKPLRMWFHAMWWVTSGLSKLKLRVPRLACPTVFPALLDKPAVAPNV